MIKLKNFHTFPIRCPLGNPLFQADLYYKGRPFYSIESCTSPGTLTRHSINFPRADRHHVKALKVFLDTQGQPVDEEHWQSLHDNLAKKAKHHLRSIPDRYMASKVHKQDVEMSRPRCFLTADQHTALKRRVMDMDLIWDGLKEAERALRNDEKKRRDAKEARLKEQRAFEKEQEKAAAQRIKQFKNAPPVYPTEDYKYFEAFALEMDFIFTKQEMKLVARGGALGLYEKHWKVKSQSVEAFLLARAAALHSDREFPVYTPAQLELYMRWPEHRRLRWVNEVRPGPGPTHQEQAWEYDTPYLWDTPDAREWADSYYDLLPKNWDDLPSDLQFDPQTPENYR